MASKKFLTQVKLLDDLKQEKKEIDEQIKEVETFILSELEKSNESTVTVDVDERKYKVTRVQATRTSIDEGTLKRSLGEKLWMKVSTRSLDKKKLEAHIASCEVEPLVVAEATTETQTSPYIRLT